MRAANEQAGTHQGERRRHDEQLVRKRVAILATDGVERIELEQPQGGLHGPAPPPTSSHRTTARSRPDQFDLISAGTLKVDRALVDMTVDEYDALLLPGGTVNPDNLHRDKEAVDFVKSFVSAGKPIAAICHGPWTLLEAGAVTGRG